MRSFFQGLVYLIGGVLFIVAFIYLGQCNNKLYEQRSKGVVIEKIARPAWVSSGDNYYLKIRTDSEELMVDRVSQETYMKTNVGDRYQRYSYN